MNPFQILPYFIRIQRGIFKKLFNKIHLGKRVSFEKATKAVTEQKGVISIGEKSTIKKYSQLVSVGGDLQIGKNCYFNINANIVCRYKITIGSKCSFGPGVTIYDHDHKFGKNGLEPGYNCKEIIIGDNCWLGTNVIILKGTHIGNNCVIGAGCVVSGDIPDSTLVTQNRELLLKKLK